MTDPPPGPAHAQGEPAELGQVVERAADLLAMRGVLDPDEAEYPANVLAVLAALAQEPACGPLCLIIRDRLLHPSAVADHFEARCQEEYERSLPVWTCRCGRAYKLLTGQDGQRGESYYDIGADGLLGDLVGSVRRTPQNTVKHSDKCPECTHPFAIVQAPAGRRPARRDGGPDPRQQRLF